MVLNGSCGWKKNNNKTLSRELESLSSTSSSDAKLAH